MTKGTWSPFSGCCIDPFVDFSADEECAATFAIVKGVNVLKPYTGGGSRRDLNIVPAVFRNRASSSVELFVVQ